MVRVKTNSSGAPVNSLSYEYIYAGSQMLAALGSTWTRYLHQDHLSPRVFTDENGAVTHQEAHYPFGDMWYEGPGNTPLKFTTYERDSASGLDYAIFRFHGPRLGRFMQTDPVCGNKFDPQRLNLFAYVANDPINLVDPLGLCPAGTAAVPCPCPAGAPSQPGGCFCCSTSTGNPFDPTGGITGTYESYPVRLWTSDTLASTFWEFGMGRRPGFIAEPGGGGGAGAGEIQNASLPNIPGLPGIPGLPCPCERKCYREHGGRLAKCGLEWAATEASIALLEWSVTTLSRNPRLGAAAGQLAGLISPFDVEACSSSSWQEFSTCMSDCSYVPGCTPRPQT